MPENHFLIGGVSSKLLLDVIEICCKLPDVNLEVHKNHDDNLWWPLYVTDWRLRMIFAGWSTRISYNMINTYRRVVSDVHKKGYDSLITISDQELRQLIGSLGLFDLRKKFMRSMVAFIQSFIDPQSELLLKSNDELIELIVENVNGASYKVSQCAALYAKGYYCGVFPIDSGMKDLLGPCLGLSLPSGPIANEVMRHYIENNLYRVSDELHQIAFDNGYSDLNIPKSVTPIWWAHLVLIYFKRLYCNKKKPNLCPLRANSKTNGFMGMMCDRQFPESGGFKYIILEGPDKSGKTTLAKCLNDIGYTIIHSSYNPDHKSFRI